MKNAAAILLLTLFALFSPKSAWSHERKSENIRFEIKQVLSCSGSKDVELCLKKIFGDSIGYKIVEGKGLQSVNFPKIKNGSLILNGVKFSGLFNPSIIFFGGENFYSVCGVKQPLAIDNFVLTGGGDCLCGFNSSGEFKRHLNYRWAFISKKTKVSIATMRCIDNNQFSTNGLTLLEGATICGYQFPKETEFYDLGGAAAFVAPKDGNIENRTGDLITVKKGLEYMSDSSFETPCQWKQVPVRDETEVAE